jgi:hypothetical protein
MQFFKQHVQQTLAAVALVFLGIIAAYYVWGIATISLAVSQVTDSASHAGATTLFDLEKAEDLNLRGLKP